MYEYQTICFCAGNGPWVVEVDGSGAVVQSSADTTPLTIEDQFARVQDAIDRQAHSITVTFDGALGYPTHWYADYSANLADEEFGVQVNWFTPR